MSRPRRLQRRIVFYRWENVPGDAPPFDRVGAATAISQLPDADWASEEADGFITAVLVDRPGDDNGATWLRCFRLRQGDDLPHVISARRQASPLQLQGDESVGDWTHVVIWPDGYAAHDSRRDAPALSRLRAYLGDQVNQWVRFVPLYDRSLIDQLDALDEVKAVQIKFELSKADQRAQAAQVGLFAGLLQVGQSTGAVTIDTKVSVGQKRSIFLNHEVKDEVTGLADQAEGFLDNLVVTGLANNEVVTVDLLRRRLDERILVNRSPLLGNAPDPTTMFRAIEQTRSDLQQNRRLPRAVRVH
ncbi:MAG: hypothetical protein ACREMY_21380 [bacterium]